MILSQNVTKTYHRSSQKEVRYRNLTSSLTNMNTLNLLETDSSPEIHFENFVFQRKIRNLNQKKCLQEKFNLVKQNNF